MRCRFINAFTADVKPVPPRPPVPPTPTPSPQPAPPPAAAPEADLVVTKRALQPRVNFGAIARFEITVRNTGEAAAEQVVVADDPGSNAQLVSARPSQGSCNERTPLICRLGAIAPGGQATIRVSVRAIGTPAIDNLAVAGSSTPETRVDNNAPAHACASAHRAGSSASSASAPRSRRRPRRLLTRVRPPARGCPSQR